MHGLGLIYPKYNFKKNVDVVRNDKINKILWHN